MPKICVALNKESLFVVGLISLVVGFVLIIIEISICENIIQGKIKREYQNQLAIRNMKVQQDMQRVLNENKVKPIIQSRINEIESQIFSTTEALKNLYDVGVVYPKYHALVPIVMFCEYLESGRCNVLEGHEGDYNIYENELRQNIIIAKLDVVINKLDQAESVYDRRSNRTQQTSSGKTL